MCLNFFGCNVVVKQLAEHTEFTNTTRNQLIVLTTEVEHDNLF